MEKNLIPMKRSGVTLMCEPNEVATMLNNGYKKVGEDGKTIDLTPKAEPKVWDKLKVDDLRSMAVMLGIPTTDEEGKKLKAKELSEAIVDVTTEAQREAILQGL